MWLPSRLSMRGRHARRLHGTGGRRGGAREPLQARHQVQGDGQSMLTCWGLPTPPCATPGVRDGAWPAAARVVMRSTPPSSPTEVVSCSSLVLGFAVQLLRGSRPPAAPDSSGAPVRSPISWSSSSACCWLGCAAGAVAVAANPNREDHIGVSAAAPQLGLRLQGYPGGGLRSVGPSCTWHFVEAEWRSTAWAPQCNSQLMPREA